MNNFKFLIALILVVVLALGLGFLYKKGRVNTVASQDSTGQTNENPLSIEALRKRDYSGSDLTIEQTLPSGSNYREYIASYNSDGLKIYGLLTVPTGQKPAGGWPVIIFNHGYIPPEEYQTTERYVAYVDAFAKSGYIVFKPDFRGNGASDGQPQGAYFSSGYLVDDLNAIASIKKFPDANADKIGVWGHSMGGNITLKDLVISRDIKAAVVWGGVVGSYNDIINNWQGKVAYHPSAQDLALRNKNRQNLINTYGTPDQNPTFWNSIDPTYFLSDITAPVQLDVGGADEEVPVVFSESLRDKLLAAGKSVEFYIYPGGNHNISSPNFNLAMKRSIEFFDKYLK